ncbi:MAG: SET domain-containing protein-lysine N-methyltransferase [Williamsia sp.]|nr:SET domain-containing protein-lysine N-methyltransferase [Williamsia sp.]
MKICVLQPDYSTCDVDYKNYDPHRDLSALLPGDTVHHVFLNKLTTYKQLKELSRENYDIYVNLCEGYLDWPVPSIDVIHSLDGLNLPYTGTNAVNYDPPKPVMKYVAYCAGVKTPRFAELASGTPVAQQVPELSFPLFVKPARSGDSLGIDQDSLVYNSAQLEAKVESLLQDGYDPVLVEEYIEGSEYTVLIAAPLPPEEHCLVFKPVEYQFPAGRSFKTYALKTSELHPGAHIPCRDKQLEKKLMQSAERIFTDFSPVGYARLDFRVDKEGEVYFLEINFTCSVFYEQGYEGSADEILRYDPMGKAGFLQHIIREGMARHAAKQKKYTIHADALNGYGIVANQPIKKGEIVFPLEGSSQRIVTRRHVEKNWTPSQVYAFRQYAYPLSKEVFVLWPADPQQWAPQNHSCMPNTKFDGLNVIAIADVPAGTELTLDYGAVMDETMDPFSCECGSEHCRKTIKGIPGNSITNRSKKATKIPSVQYIDQQMR